jgi:hypothetical protein
MRTQLTHLTAIVVVAATAACSIEIRAGGDAATGMFERTLAVTGPVDLDVQTGSGTVLVRQGAEGEVRVTGHVRARRGLLSAESGGDLVAAVEANPPVAQDGNLIRLGGNEHDGRHVSISYEVIVPPNASLRARTGSGRIEIPSLDGPVDARTGSGSIALGRISGAVAAETGSGSIEVLGAGDGLTARTGSGSIRGLALSGPVRAESGSGRIEVSYTGPGDGDLSTGSGSVVVHGIQGGLRVRTGSGGVTVDGTPTSAWGIEAGSGRITLRLPADAAFDLDAHSRSGSVQTNHPIVGSASSRGNRQLQGQVRGGGPRILVSTGSGSIRVD